MNKDDQPQHPDEPLDKEEEGRAVSVRLHLSHYRLIRTIAVTRDLTNSGVVEWALELLDRHVQAGGSR